jgi:hypothetical protein
LNAAGDGLDLIPVKIIEHKINTDRSVACVSVVQEFVLPFKMIIS